MRPGTTVVAYGLEGSWRVRVGKGACGLSLYKGFSPNGGGATTQGCASSDLADVGNWILQGQSLTLTKSMVVSVATLRRTASNRFVGATRKGERITISR